MSILGHIKGTGVQHGDPFFFENSHVRYLADGKLTWAKTRSPIASIPSCGSLIQVLGYLPWCRNVIHFASKHSV